MFLSLMSCGFTPLYVGAETSTSVSGEQLVEETASIFVNEIPEHVGQILRKRLLNRLTPKGEPENPRYRLTVLLSESSVYQQGIRLDNLATRSTMTYTATYILRTYPGDKKILEDNTSARASYNILESPYATDVSEKNAKERIMRMLGDNISLRLAAFLKNKDHSKPLGTKTK